MADEWIKVKHSELRLMNAVIDAAAKVVDSDIVESAYLETDLSGKVRALQEFRGSNNSEHQRGQSDRPSIKGKDEQLSFAQLCALQNIISRHDSINKGDFNQSDVAVLRLIQDVRVLLSMINIDELTSYKLDIESLPEAERTKALRELLNMLYGDDPS